MDTKELFGPKGAKVNWVTVIALVVFHVGAVAACFMFSWSALVAGLVMYWIAIGLGIGLGYHRLHTHRGYRAPKWLEYTLAVCGTLSLQGGPIYWVALHRVHHANSDREGDPHSPRDGAFWSHLGWIVFGQPMHNDADVLARFAPDISKDRFYIWLTRYHYVPVIAAGFVLLGLGGWPFVFWGIALRTVVGLHATWFVNSAAHLWGSQRFQTKDDSRNNWWVALLTFGEGWHNNHHAHPTSARHGLAWYEFDMTWVTIRLLNRIGLVDAVKVARPAKSPSRRVRRNPEITLDPVAELR